MRRTLGALCACSSPARDESSYLSHHSRKLAPGSGTALGESFQQSDASSEVELGLRPGAATAGRSTDSPRSIVPPTVTELQSNVAGGLAAKHPKLRRSSTLSRLGDERQQVQQTGGKGATPALLVEASSPRGSPLTNLAVRFATSSTEQLQEISDSGSIGKAHVSRAQAGDVMGICGKVSRVRLLLPSDSAKSSGGGRSSSGGSGGGKASEDLALTRSSVSASAGNSRKLMNAPSSSGKVDGEPRALAQLVDFMLEHHVDYRLELEAVMATHGPAFPSHLLEEMLTRRGVALPSRRLRVIFTLYRAEEGVANEQPDAPQGDAAAAKDGTARGSDDRNGDGKIDGVALLKDLDRAAFRHIALGGGTLRVGGTGGKNSSAGPSRVTSAANSRKNPMPGGKLGDKTRILQLVATQLATDESLHIRAGSDAVLTPEHLQEVVEQIDLTCVAVPLGMRAPYVPSTEDPDSLKVPVWSLRAMQLRKQKRDQVLTGSDPHLRRLGQAGRDALRKQLTCRSLQQQQEIIASAVVAAARAAVVPSMRLMENTIHRVGPSRGDSLQRTGSKNNRILQRQSTTTKLPTTANATATAKTDCVAGGGSGDELKDRSKCEEGSRSAMCPGKVQDGGRGGRGGGDDSSPATARQTLSTNGVEGCDGQSPFAVRASKTSLSGVDAGGNGGGGVVRHGASLSVWRRTMSQESGHAPGGVGGVSSGIGSPARDSVDSSGVVVLEASSRKAMGSIGSGATILPVMVVPPMSTSKPPSPLPLPPLQQLHLQKEDSPLRGLVSELELYSVELSGAGEESQQQLVGLLMQSGSPSKAVEAAQRTAHREGHVSSPRKSGWEGTFGGAGGESRCTGNGSGANGDGNESRDGGRPPAAAVNAVSTDAPSVAPSMGSGGGGIGGKTTAGSLRVSPPGCPPTWRLPLQARYGGSEPQGQPEAGLLRVQIDLEPAVKQWLQGKERSNTSYQVSCFEPLDPAHLSGFHRSSLKPDSVAVPDVDAPSELPGQCNLPEVPGSPCPPSQRTVSPPIGLPGP